MAEARAEVRRLQAANAEQGRDLATTSEELIAVLYKLETANGRIETLQRELDAAHHRERCLVAELHARKHEEASSHSTRSNVTPLRPRDPRSKR